MKVEVIINHKGEVGLHIPERDVVIICEPAAAEKLGLALLKASGSRFCPPEIA